jgi:hypothetical protein
VATTRTRKPSPEFVAAREAVVINCGDRPVEYGRITVRDRRSGEMVEILDTDHDPSTPATKASRTRSKKARRSQPIIPR